MLAVEDPSRSCNPAACPEELTRFRILSSLSKYLIMWINGDPTFFLFFPTNPQRRRNPFHRLYLYDHQNYIPEDVMFSFIIPSNHLSILRTHVLHRVTATLRYLLVDSIVYTTNLVNRPKSDRKATDTTTRWIRLADSHLLLSCYRVMGECWIKHISLPPHLTLETEPGWSACAKESGVCIAADFSMSAVESDLGASW